MTQIFASDSERESPQMFAGAGWKQLNVPSQGTRRWLTANVPNRREASAWAGLLTLQ